MAANANMLVALALLPAASAMSTVFSKRSFFISAPFVGNVGWDPLGFSTMARDDGEPMLDLVALRHAEVKHGRLAMLAAVAWPMQELLHPLLVDTLRAVGAPCSNVLDACDGFTPSPTTSCLSYVQSRRFR